MEHQDSKKENIMEQQKKFTLDYLLSKRWSPRSFKNIDIDLSTIRKIFNAGKQIASSYNEQPWRFILTTQKSSSYEKMFSALSSFNQKWASTAPILGIGFAKLEFSNQDEKNKHAKYDLGAFMTTATLKALEYDVFVHQMAGFNAKKIEKDFEIDSSFEAVVAFVMGRLGKPKQLPDQIQQKESPQSPRKNLDKFLFFEKWKHPLNKENY